VTGETFDAFLLDIGLPGMDGTELARRLRVMPVGRNALMVAVTGYGQHFDRRNALRAGFDFYFVKPVEPPKLLAVLAQFQESKFPDK
jgi:CheY-like chemotaxis protein